MIKCTPPHSTGSKFWIPLDQIPYPQRCIPYWTCRGPCNWQTQVISSWTRSSSHSHRRRQSMRLWMRLRLRASQRLVGWFRFHLIICTCFSFFWAERVRVGDWRDEEDGNNLRNKYALYRTLWHLHTIFIRAFSIHLKEFSFNYIYWNWCFIYHLLYIWSYYKTMLSSRI